MSPDHRTLAANDKARRAAYEDLRLEDCRGERRLKLDILRGNHPELAAFPFLCANEWEPRPGLSQWGCGDLVCTDGRGSYAVIELKWVNTGGNRENRRKKRRKVVWQAKKYARMWAVLHPDARRVIGFSYTEETGLREEFQIEVPEVHRSSLSNRLVHLAS
jgi:hypothetical protein